MHKVVISLFAAFLLQPASAQFIEGFEERGLNGFVFELAVFDDGGGEALYAGGRFSLVDGQPAGNIAKWDGTSWTTLGGANSSSSGWGVRALEVFNDGGGAALYAIGDFGEIAGFPVGRIARWDGTSWTSVPGLPPFVELNAVAVFDDGSGPALFVGDDDGALHKWNGTFWRTVLPSQSGEDIAALEVFGSGASAVLMIGRATVVGGMEVGGLESWDGSTLTPVETAGGVGLDGSAGELLVADFGDGEKLYVGGEFSIDGTDHRLVSWDGSQWDTGFTNPPCILVDDLGIFPAPSGPRLAVASCRGWGTVSYWQDGEFVQLTSAGAEGLEHVSGNLSNVVDALAVFDAGEGPQLFAGGRFDSDGLTTTSRVARWDGADWRGVDGGGLGCSGEAFGAGFFEIAGQESLYLAGSGNFGGLARPGVASFDGTSWARVRDASGAEAAGRAVEAFDDGFGTRLFAARNDTIAAWDGSTWQTALSGLASSGVRDVRRLLSFELGGGPLLAVGGHFVDVESIAVNHVAVWDGSVVSPLMGPGGTAGVDLGTEGPRPEVYALEVFDDGNGPALYIGGDFTEAGGDGASYLARWDGVNLEPVSIEALDDVVLALEVFDDGGGRSSTSAVNSSTSVPRRSTTWWPGTAPPSARCLA